MSNAVRAVTTGRAIPMRGNDIDTDRIIPARYLKSITFDGLGEGAFIDARAADRTAGRTHPFDDPRYSGGSILLVGAQLWLRLLARARAAGAAAVRDPRHRRRVVRGDFFQVTARCWGCPWCAPAAPTWSGCRRWSSRTPPPR